MKSDKELTVELVSAYLGAWFSRDNVKTPLTGADIKSLVEETYAVIHKLPEGE